MPWSLLAQLGLPAFGGGPPPQSRDVTEARLGIEVRHIPDQDLEEVQLLGDLCASERSQTRRSWSSADRGRCRG